MNRQLEERARAVLHLYEGLLENDYVSTVVYDEARGRVGYTCEGHRYAITITVTETA